MATFSVKMRPTKMKSKSLLHGISALEHLQGTLDEIGKVVVERAKANVSGRILNVRTGKLRDSLTFKSDAQSKGWKLVIGHEAVVYAAIHELGGWAGRYRATRIPKRMFLRKALVQEKQVVRDLLRGYFKKMWYK